jgi:RNA polymerase sigma factor (sigma-70 family)
VAAAGQTASPASERALATLCELYWLPLYGYVRRCVADEAEAKDLTQAFFAELLERNSVRVADPERGRFRSFLLTAFKHFLSKQWDKAKAQKRGGAKSLWSLDLHRADSKIRIEPAAGLTAEQAYDRQWAVTLLENIMQQLHDEWATAGRASQFELLKPFLIGDHAGTTYADVAERLQISAGAAKMSATRLRKRYRELLRLEISETVATPEDVDEEIRNLFATLQL